MAERFDAIVIGAGPGGEVAVDRLQRGGMHVALIERELIGGECGYWGCIPSKTLIRATTVVSEARHVPGIGTPGMNWEEVAAYRDYMIRHLDDKKQVQSYEQQGITFVRGEAHIVAPGRVEVAGKILEAPDIIVATGSQPNVPDIPGLREAGYWTNREATGFSEIPDSVVLLGGSTQSIELGQMFRRFGSAVTIVARAPRLLRNEEPELVELITEQLAADGVIFRFGREPRQVTREADGIKVVYLDDGSQVRGEQIILATGRSPRIDHLGLETTGAKVTKKGVEIDEHCRAAPGLWAVGDMTGVAQFTHVAKYQARIAADTILGRPRPTHYDAIPRIIFSDPEIGSTGMLAQQARDKGIDVTTATIDLYQTLARPHTYGKDIHGRLGLVADRKRGVLIGAWVMGPEASEWIHQAVLAIRAATPVSVLRDVMAQFPTFSEAYIYALEALDV